MDHPEHTIAVVGMSCRFPGARDISEYWKNLCDGVESITFFSPEYLQAAGVSPEVWQDPGYVSAYGVMPDAYAFDAMFFGVSQSEARVLDPQQRVLLECAWGALEDAGCDPKRFEGSIGVFAGSGCSDHEARVLTDPALLSSVGSEVTRIGNSRDFLSTRISHKLDLHGPSVTVLTACSTSLVAIHSACQSLLSYECDLALAGGCTIEAAPAGYHYQEGGKLSPDGHCRAFDSRNAGIVPGSGAGIVALKRLADALRDSDTIHALVRGSAINNDGSAKVGFTAPSVSGQAQCIAEALTVAAIESSAIDYVEAHGTGTELGDPIEIAALTDVFRKADRNSKCALGAVKTNIGHLDAAAGVAGFIKVVLALKHHLLPPTLHFERPNPETGLENSPFYVNTVLRQWDPTGHPRCAGVSSFGIGGTNAHVVLQEAPERPQSATDDDAQLLVLSAKSEAALSRMRSNLAAHLSQQSDVPLADIAYTLQEGRAAHPYRWAAVARDVRTAQETLSGMPQAPQITRRAAERLDVAFLFPGGGTQYAGMARELYTREPRFRDEIDQTLEVVRPHMDLDLRTLLFPTQGTEHTAQAQLEQICYALPALFAVEYALAQLWLSWGIRPVAMLGHSLGEYVAASLAGVFTRDNAIQLVVARARLMQSLPAGAMLAVLLPGDEVRAMLPAAVSLAAVNSRSYCVVSGPPKHISELETLLARRDVMTRPLHVSHAAHSSAMDPILEDFEIAVRKAQPSAPQLPFVSNLTGDWITEKQATDPRYWVRHLRETVRFVDGLHRLRERPDCALLEVGPGETLGTFARRDLTRDHGGLIVKSLPAANRPEPSDVTMLEALGSLWTAGVDVDWPRVRGRKRRSRIALPTYPFERTEYRVSRTPNVAPTPAAVSEQSMKITKEANVDAERRGRIVNTVVAIFARLLGAESTDLDTRCTFLELGADSLLLMQASRSIESEFGLRVPFRLLLTKLSTIESLSAHLDDELPAYNNVAAGPSVNMVPRSEAPARTPSSINEPAAAPVPALPMSQAAGAGAPGIQAIVAQQLALMQSQLELLRNGSVIPDTQIARENTTPPSVVLQPPAATTTIDNLASHGPHRPIRQTIHQGGSYSPQQQQYFDGFVQKYNARTRLSKKYAEEHRPALADNRAALGFRMLTKELVYPVVGTRSQGSRIWDLDENEYIDFTGGFGVHFFGHRPSFVVEAVEEQLRRGFHLGPQSDLAGPAARLLCELTGMERAAFCNTGTEAVMTAIRIARTATGRNRIVIFHGSYHGCFDGVLARGTTRNGQPRTMPAAPGIPQGMVDDVVILPYGSTDALDYLEANGASLAAVLVEPVQSRNIELHPREFLQRVRALTERSGTVLMFDELITGFRLGPKGAQGFFGVKADLATYGKLIGGGFPIGVVAGRAHLMDVIDGGQWNFGDDSFPVVDQTFFAGTFCKHPLTMAAVCAVLGYLREQGAAFYENLNARAARLVAELRRVIADEEVPIQISSCATLFQFHGDSQDSIANLLIYHLLQHGMYIWEGRGCFLSTAHTDEDCNRLVVALRASISELRKGGFLPERRTESAVTSIPTPISASTGLPRSFPLTSAQRQIWVHAQFGDEASCAYNEQFLCRLRGQLDLEALSAALVDIVQHHEGLRTVFDASGDMQHVLPAGPIALRVHQMMPQRASSPEWLDAVLEPIDLTTGPMFRVHVYRSYADDDVLQIVFHHISIDGLAFSLMRRDLELAYAARCAGVIPTLPPAMQLSTYVALLAERASEHAGKEADWLRRFEGAIPLGLPTDRPRQALPTSSATAMRLTLSTTLTTMLKEYGSRQGFTLFMTLFGGLLITLHRFADQDDIVVGIPYAGRPFPDADSLVAQCVDVLPIRNRISSNEKVLPFLRVVRESLFDAYEHEMFTYAHLQEKLQLSHGPYRTPLISVAFNLEPADMSGGGGTPLFADLEMQEMDNFAGALAKVDIHIDAVERGSEIELICLYNTDLFESVTMEKLMAAWLRVLEQVVIGPEVRLSEVSLLDETERQELARTWNRTETAYPADRCIHELIEEQVRKTPQAVAVSGDEQLSYEELNRRANQVAHYLTGLGVGPETRVGVCLRRGVQQVVAVLGVLKAGGAYVPLDPAYPAERLAFLMRDAGVAILLTEERLLDVVPVTEGMLVSLDGFAATEVMACSAETPECSVDPENLAYVIYTSGSTGQPKGVQIAHGGVVNLACAQAREFGIRPDSRVLQFASLSFDAAVSEIFTTLVSGATLVMASSEALLPGPGLTETLQQQRITVVTLPPAVLAVQPPTGLPELRTVVSAGEALSAAVLAQWATGGRRLINAYGPTEVTVCASQGVCTVDGQAPGLGQALANMQLYVMDAAGAPVPVGVPGELYVGGAGLARGYLGRPGLTAAAFVPDPFGPAGGRLYRTGDRVRRRADGTLEFLGRRDRQIKLRGFRIEVAEVERALMAQPAVRAAAILLREDAPGDRRLVAYAVGEADGSQLREQLRRTLPEYMVPSVVVMLDKLPLTTNGKVDAAALPSPDTSTPPAKFVAPRTPLEEALAAIWADVLQVAPVGATDDFFDLGGHSLLATRLVTRVRDVLGVELPVGTLFERPTVAALAVWVEEVRRTAAPALASIPIATRSEPLPLSFGQQRLWFLDQMQPGNAFNNVASGLRLHGALDVRALERALGEILRRHEVLRTTFAEVENSPAQIIAPFTGFTLTIEDLSSLPAAERDAAAQRRTQEEAARPFDLAAGPLFRASLLRLADDNHTLLLCAHHITSDGWSMALLFRELSSLYAAYREGHESPLPPLSLQYADYALWQREQLQSDTFAQQLAWWKAHLAGTPELLPLPTDHPRPAIQTDNGAVEAIRLPRNVLERLEALGRQEGATLYMVLLCAWQMVLCLHSGTEDITVGTTIAGRTRQEIEPLIGLFMSTLVLRTDLSGDPSFKQMLRRVRTVTLGAFDHQDVPFERIVDMLQPARSLSYSPLFQVLFELQDASATSDDLAGLKVNDVPVDLEIAKFDLSLSLTTTADGLVGGLIFRTELFERSTIRCLVEHFVRVLEQVTVNSEVRLSELAVIEGTELESVVQRWNQTAVAYPEDRCIHELFEAQVAKTPDSTAVTYREASLTYREFDTRADQLARELRELRVGPEVRVGIYLERSLELMVAVLGVLKAGGAYVPIDPKYPAERVSYILTDSGVTVLLTQQSLQATLVSPDTIEVLSMDQNSRQIAPEIEETVRNGPTAENLAYVIYTSGSTGQPKGVAMHHRGVCNYIDWAVRYYGADRGTGAPVFSSMAVDLTITNLLPLFAGKPVHFLSEENPVEELAEVLRKRPGFGLIKITPIHLDLLTTMLEPAEMSGVAETLVIGADFLMGEPTVVWQDHASDVRLINEYGPTETVVGCSAYELPPGRHRAGPVPVGGPIQNLRFYVLDSQMRPVAPGIGGELYIGGEGVARGYFGQPGLTAEKFLPDIFAAPGARMYRSGDRARWMADGNLLILGRTDKQVKIRGFRVELGEVEVVLRRHPAVSTCLVVVREDSPGDRRLVAYVVGDADWSDLREHLRRSLPEYMVPVAFVRLPALPRTSTGKIDPRTLPAPDYTVPDEQSAAPRTSIEQTLAAIWADVLNLKSVGVNSNFFALGGDSILAMQVVSKARRARLHLSPRQMFEHQTIAKLATLIPDSADSPALQTEPTVDGTVPLTPIQARYFEQDLRTPSHNNQSTLWLVDASVSDAVLESALAAVFAYHDALRLRFRKTSGIWEQWYSTEPAIALEWMDLSGLSSSEQDRVQEELANEKQASLDLEQGPLGRAVLFIRDVHTRVLLLILHHLVVDVVSWNILIQDLERSCAQAQSGAPIDPGEKSTSFRRWSEAARAYASSEALRSEIPYWQAQGSEGIAPLPLDSKEESTQQDLHEVTLRLNADETRSLLQRVPSTQQTQINETILWALAETVAEWTGSTRVRIALEGHGREEIMPDIDLTHTVGWFTSIYPVVLDISMSQSSDPDARLRSVSEQLRAVPTRGVGYGILRYLSEDASVRTTLSAQPEPQLIFNYIGQLDRTSQGRLFRFAEGPTGRERDGANSKANHLELNCGVIGGALQMSWVFNDGVYRPETIQALADAHAAHLRHLIEFSRADRSDKPSSSLLDLSIAALDRDDLNLARNGSTDIEDVYPLSPMQEGMLFHAVSEADAQAYQVEVAYLLNGTLSLPLFQRAWARVVARHAILRTSFLWEGLSRPLQRVHRAIDIPWHIEDWRGVSADKHEHRLDCFLADDRAKGFDLQQPPLMRCAVLQTSDNEHWFVWSQHHLLMDGWSCSRVLSEVLRLYDAWNVSRSVNLTAARPYRDYIGWLQKQDQKGAEHYWRKVMAGYTPPARLGVETARESSTERRADRNLWLTADLTQQLEKMARQYSLTLNTILLGAWGLLLSRYGGQEDIVVGVTVSGRQAELDGVENMVGLFINTLPIRIRLSADAKFGDWLSTLQRGQAEARDYEYAPLVWVQQWSDMPRAAQLFEAHFIFENYPIDRSGQPADDTQACVRITDTRGMEWNHYPLSLLAGPGQQLLLRLSYDETRFSAITIQRMQEQLERILEQVAGDASVRLSEVTLLDAGERALVLDTWNQTERSYPADQGIHELFAAQAMRTPEALALVCGSETLSYRELDRRANQMAHYLRELGVGPEVRVGLCLERSPELLVAILGVLKSGGAYVPLDRQYPSERLAFMLTDSTVPVLLVQERLAALIPVPAGVHVVCLDTVETQAALARQSDQTPASGIDAENLCYVIYTSGSTGRPKGVAMHHRGVCNYIAWGVEAYGAREGNGAPVFTSMAVDLTITNLLPLFAGKPVHLLPEENPVEELAEILRTRPDFGLIKITPTHLTLLTPLLTPAEARAATRTLVVGADFLMAEPTLFWQEHAPQVRLLNEYGPTETVVGCSAHVLAPGIHSAGPVPVGGPIQNLCFYVLDAHREPVPVGLPGELYIGGVGVARGYLGRPGLTAEKFLPDPFGAPGSRMYRTGDRARWLESGSLLILGRVDHQIKLRGFRVELGEVEAVLRRHPGVRDSLVIARKTPAGDTQLVAYIVGSAHGTELRDHLRRHLPEYMLPSAFVPLDSLPQTATGKLNHDALPPPEDPNTNRQQSADDAPKNFTEVQLIHIWEELLGTERIGATQNFFDVGGNSLIALRLFAQIKRRLNCDLPLSILFDNATVRGMATAILGKRGRSEERHGSIVPLQPHGTLPPLFCVHPAGRTVHGYVHLVRNLGADQPAFGIEDCGALDRPISQIASDHLQALRQIQPHGPYHILGWSFGGCVAYEMALQLEQQSETVAFLGLMDTMEPMLWHGQPQLGDLDLVMGLASDVAAQMGRPFSICREQLEGIGFEQQCQMIADELRAQGNVPGDFSATWLSDGFEVVRARHRSQRHYTPGRFQNRLTLFRPSEVPVESERIFAPFGEEEQRTLCWCRLVEDRIEVHRIPGGHVTMGSEPNVRVLAQYVSESLAAARTRER